MSGRFKNVWLLKKKNNTDNLVLYNNGKAFKVFTKVRTYK